MLSVNRLRVLHELDRRGTLAEVARALNYTPSAVSQHLSALERETGVVLLEHVGRGVRLTDAARILVGHTELILAQLERAESDLAAGLREVRGSVRVASFQSVLLEIAPRALSVLAADHPGLEVQLIHREVEDAHPGLLAHEFDLVLGEEFPGAPLPAVAGVHRENFLADPLRLALPAGMPETDRPRRLVDLATRPWALDPPGTRMGDWSLARCRAAGFEPLLRCETPDPLLHIHLVRTGHAVAFTPALLGAQHLAGVDLVTLAGEPSRMLYTEVRTGREQHPVLVAVRHALAAAVASSAAVRPAFALSE